MIALTGNSITTTPTDVLRITTVTIDLVGGSLSATLQRGTVIGSPGEFAPNMPDVQIFIQSDGSFTSGRGSSWEGTVKGLPELIATLRAQFDQMVVSSGLVTGTAESVPVPVK